MVVNTSFASVQSAPLRRFPHLGCAPCGYNGVMVDDPYKVGYNGLVVNDPYKVGYNGLIIRDSGGDPRRVLEGYGELPDWKSPWVIATAAAAVGAAALGFYFLFK